jgi:hypothetical protein
MYERITEEGEEFDRLSREAKRPDKVKRESAKRQKTESIDAKLADRIPERCRVASSGGFVAHADLLVKLGTTETLTRYIGYIRWSLYVSKDVDISERDDS